MLKTILAQHILIVFVSGKSNLKLYVISEMIGSNFVAGFNYSGMPNVTCLAHGLQRAINDGVLAQKDVQDLFPEIVGHYKHFTFKEYRLK